MNLVHYWPSEKYISECIRTEAEELPEHVLLSVHEPMHLTRIGGNNEVELKTEQDLLSDFLQIERPIPIIGRSGVGKSHLIRWIDAQLKLKPECKNWHIVRIPKNASLRQVLELLLKDLEDEVFEKARQNISTVGEQLNTKDVAELLLTFMSQQLVKLRDSMQARKKEIALNPELRNLPSIREEIEYLKKINSHTQDKKGLSELITDSHFRQNFLNENHCIYKFAQRLTSGVSDLDLQDNDYQIRAEDLNFEYEIHDLSISARKYVEAVFLNTSHEARQQAVDILNDVLSEANKALFRQLFSFSSGSFIDLFKDIRRFFKQKGQTLVVLVEDMAAISAIEDVLIDSLLEESVKDGEQELCVLRSAIAVTEGYPGYLRRQGTIKTRAQYEWRISDKVEEGNDLYNRIVEFVARYLNAARFGSAELHQAWNNRQNQNDFPRWEKREMDEMVQTFGVSPTLKIPLFPFNRNAIVALVNRFCKEDGEIKFNPRQILNHIVLRVLKGNKVNFEAKKFPYANFAEMTLSLRVSRELNRFKDPSRCCAIAAVWGYDSRSIDELANRLDYRVVQSFGEEDFAHYLQNFEHKSSTIPEINIPLSVTSINVETKKKEEIEKPIAVKDPLQEEFDRIDYVLEEWLQPKSKIILDQENAKFLRQELEQMFSTYIQTDKYCFNLSADMLSKIKNNANRIFINIPKAQANPPGCILKFFEEKDLNNHKKLSEIQSVSLALLRNYVAKQKGMKAWSYEDGYKDYLIYQNFAMHWVHSSMMLFVQDMRSKSIEAMKEHIELAYRLGVWKNSETVQDRLDALLLNESELDYFGKSTLVDKIQEPLKKWNEKQKAWLDLFIQNENRYIYEGDLAISSFRAADKQINPNTVLSNMGIQIERGLRPILPIFEDLQFSNKEDYSKSLKQLIQNIEYVSQQGQYYPAQSNILPNSREFIQLIKSIDCAETWNMIKEILLVIRELHSEQGINWEKVVANVQRIDVSDLEKVIKAIEYWREFYQKSYFTIKDINDSNGANTLEEERLKIDHLLQDLGNTLQGLQA
ncbi:protein DpdH [Acinetobacter baumannii]|nr:protein DpdH [Acinetobacter baumannii]